MSPAETADMLSKIELMWDLAVAQCEHDIRGDPASLYPLVLARHAVVMYEKLPPKEHYRLPHRPDA